MTAEISAQVGITDARAGKGMATLDYDNDGDLDVFVVNSQDHPILYRNDGGNQKDWLIVKTVGTGIGVGARMFLTIEEGGPTMVREMRAGNNFLGQNEMMVHFGLGNDTGPLAKLTIQWPNGETEVLSNIERNQTLAFVRGTLPPMLQQPTNSAGTCAFPPSPVGLAD